MDKPQETLTTEPLDEAGADVVPNSSLTAVIEKKLERLILSGQIKAGERLNEIQLARQFDVSRGPVREAARSLAARGLAQSVPNRGFFVRSIPLKEALEIYDLRAAIFGLAGRLVADRMSDQIFHDLEGFVDRMDAFALERNFEGYYPVNLAFHAYLIDATDNTALKREYFSLVNKIHLCRATGLVHKDGMFLSNREHRDMVDALASGDKIRAQESFFRHVERAKRRFEQAAQTASTI